MEQLIEKLKDRINLLETRINTHGHTGYDSSLLKRRFTVFSGSVASDGTEVMLPSGWTSAKTATGLYTITHNLQTTNYSVVITPGRNGIETRATVTSFSKSTTSFGVNTIITSTSTDNDFPFDFIVVVKNLNGNM